MSNIDSSDTQTRLTDDQTVQTSADSSKPTKSDHANKHQWMHSPLSLCQNVQN